jgi:hypothetical protein
LKFEQNIKEKTIITLSKRKMINSAKHTKTFLSEKEFYQKFKPFISETKASTYFVKNRPHYFIKIPKELEI